MTITRPAADLPAPGTRVTVMLIPKVEEELGRLQEHTKLSKTDVTNRAITVYGFVNDLLESGYEILARDIRTGETQLVQLVEAPEEQAERSPSSHRRFHRPALIGRFLLLIGLVSQATSQQ